MEQIKVGKDKAEEQVSSLTVVRDHGLNSGRGQGDGSVKNI